MSFKILDFSLMLHRLGPRRKGAQIPPLTCFRILFAGIEAILAGGKLADHGISQWLLLLVD